MILFFALLFYLIGSLMFSYWLVRLNGNNISKFGDGNPGAVNAFKAGGWKIGVPAILLDFFKGAVPVYFITQIVGITDFRLVPIAIAPVLGHAFPVFLGFRGGKAIATTFGIWTGLTLWQVPMIFGLGLILFKIIIRIKNDALSTILGMLCVLIFLIIKFDLVLVSIFFLNLIVIVYKHRLELQLKIK
jgi:glycerol-3-phosphate acyltransferase PlsY